MPANDDTNSENVPRSLLIEVATTSERLNNLATMFEQSQIHDRAFKEELVKNNKELTVAVKTSLIRHSHLEREVESLRADFQTFLVQKFAPIAEKTQTNSVTLAGNKFKFAIMGVVGVAVLTGTIGLAFYILQKVIDATVDKLMSPQPLTIYQEEHNNDGINFSEHFTGPDLKEITVSSI